MRPLALALLALAVVACSGPKPKVESATAGQVQDNRTVVAVAIRNEAGEGAIRVIVTVKEKGSGRVVGREDRTVPVKDRERITVAVEVTVPDGVSEIEAEAEAKYPPD